MPSDLRFSSMDQVRAPSVTAEALQWIEYELDASWAAKLAILGARRREDIAHFGACLAEHDRHSRELAALLRASDPIIDIPTEPVFRTNDATIVASTHEESALLRAVERMESTRMDRYEGRRRGHDGRLEALLDIHLTETRVRLAALRRLREACDDVAA